MFHKGDTSFLGVASSEEDVVSKRRQAGVTSMRGGVISKGRHLLRRCDKLKSEASEKG